MRRLDGHPVDRIRAVGRLLFVDVVDGPTAAGPEWLTDVLRRAGAIAGQRVVAVDARRNQAFNSSVTHLALRYDREETGGPERLVLKVNRDGWGEAEVALYQLAMAASVPVPAVVPCYDAAYDPGTGISHCLLLDLSETHAVPVTRDRVMRLDGVPTDPQLHAMIDAVADFHAHWWNLPARGNGALAAPAAFRDSAACAERIAQREQQFRHFVEAVGQTVDPSVLRLCERALAGLPELWADRYLRRFDEERDLTVVNGDCYFAQFLCPRDSLTGPTYLIDFQDACVQMPAEDLVFMFATFCTRAHRREGDREMRLIGRYLSRLAEHGIAYSPDTLLDDYRVCIVYQLFRTIWDQSSGAPAAYWRPKLECVIASFQDHGCADLLA
jgi:hypothetical protein